MYFFEQDLSNADITNKKIIAIEQILSHHHHESKKFQVMLPSLDNFS
jgi:hypothetical protein